MSKLWVVAGNEIRTTVRRASFLFVSFGIPIIAALIFLGVRLTHRGDSVTGEAGSTKPEAEAQAEGYVDLAGLVNELPPDMPEGSLLAYPSEQLALQALEANQIAAYYIVPDNYIESGELIYVQQEYSPLSPERQDWRMRWALLFNLLAGDLDLAKRVWVPADFQRTNLSAIENGGAADGCTTPGYGCDTSVALRYLPLVFLLIFFVSILTGASLQLGSISAEKENRIIEVLAVSVAPVELLAGKIIGIGLLGLAQFVTWVGTTYGLTVLGGSTLNLPENFSLPVSFLVWGLVFFLLGYALYASLMAGAGALTPDVKSNSGITFIIASPIYIGYLLTLVLGYNPHGWLATTLSLFPLTSPIVILWRMVQGGIPPWQTYLAAGLLVITTILTVRAVARMFRVTELLSGQPFQLKRFLKALMANAT